MRQRDDEIDPLVLQRRQIRSGSFQRVDQPDPCQLVGCDGAGRQAQADETDLQRSKRAHDVGSRAANRFAGRRVDHVRDHPLPSGFGHPLQEHIDAEVELVVAERRHVEARGIERRDHLLALEDGRLDRRRQEIARQHHERCPASGGEALLQRRDPRQSSRAVDRRDRVHVIQLQDRQRRSDARRAGLLLLGEQSASRQTCERQDREEREDAREHQPPAAPPPRTHGTQRFSD